MNIEIVNKKENPLLKRTEVRFRVTHPKEKTPQRLTVRDKLAATVGGSPQATIIEYLRTRFGASLTEGYAKIYDSAETAKKTEPQHLLRRHGLVEAKAEAKPGEKPAPKPEKAPAKAAEKPAEKPAAKPAEKHAEKPAEKHPEKPAAKPAEKHAEKPAEKHAEKPAEKHAEKPAAKAPEKK